LVPNDGTSVELKASTADEKVLVFRDLRYSRGEGGSGSTREDRLGVLFLVGVLGRGPTFSRDAAGEGREARSSSEGSESSNSREISTSNIAWYKSLVFDPTIASRNGMCLIRRGKLLYSEWAAPLLDCRSRRPVVK
jgi:hypothetical protein